jgi:exopolysaccharide biosynthesis protein
MAELCAELGCINAYNLDGASSSSVVLHYEMINALSTHKVHPVGDCIWFATLVP